MADICMCTGNCPIKEYCYRYMATANEYYQTYSALEEVCIPNNYSELIPYRKTINEELKKNETYSLESFLLDLMNRQKNN